MGTLLAGQLLADTYRIERLLGRGGMGAVYAASHVRLPQRVAIKLLHVEAAGDPEIFARFRREAEIASSLHHPNLVRVHDFNALPDGTPYLVMELLVGEDLHTRLARIGRMGYPQTLELVRGLSAGLSAAHKRDVVHRDLKPQNIFLVQEEHGDGLVEVPKILDFGISKIRHAAPDTQQTQEKELLGTPNFMSPEQARGENARVDHRTDQWALAALAYQCLTGKMAFAGDSLAGVIYQVVLSEPVPLRTLAPEVPEHAEAAIRRALSKERDDRFPSVGEFCRAFGGQTGTAIPLPVTGPPPVPLSSADAPTQIGTITGAGGQVLPPRPRRPLYLVLAAACAAALLAGVALRAGPLRHPPVVPPRPVAAPPVPVLVPTPPPPSPLPAKIAINFHVTPATATLRVGGRVLPAEQRSLQWPRSKVPVEVVATAAGFRPEQLWFVPSEGQDLEIRLEPEAPRAAPPRRPRAGHGTSHAPDPVQPPADNDAADVDLRGLR